VAETGRPVQREIKHPLTGDWLVVDCHPIRDENGETFGIIETSRNVTQEHQSVDKIRHLLAQTKRKTRELTEWRQRFDYELRAAREIQRRLVPDRPECVGGLCFDFLYEPSGEVGGDLYDIVPLNGGRVGMLISDASGHGVAAAFIAVMVRMVFRSYGLNKSSPAAVFSAVNDELLRIVPPGQFATAFYAVYDREECELVYAAAGHPAPLMLRRGADQVESIGPGGLVLGSLEDVDVQEHSTAFRPGDRLLLYTDGVADATNPRGQRFGVDRLKEAVLSYRDVHGKQFLQAIERDVLDFVGERSPEDDITLVVAECVRDEEHERMWLGT
jgi:two-component system sensor histidine kinase ChiS